MRFDPGSLMLWIDAERDAILRHFDEIQELEQRTGLSAVFAEQPAALLIEGRLHEAPVETRLFIARLFHETSHLRHHLCTSFGHIYHVMNSLLARTFVTGISAHAKTPSFAFPIWEMPVPKEPDERGFCYFEYRTESLKL